MALVDIGAETLLIYDDPNKFWGTKAMVHGFGEQMIPITQLWLKLGAEYLPFWEYRVRRHG